MLDLNFVRDNLELVKEKMRERGLTEVLGDFESLDRERRRVLMEVEGRKARRNKVSDEIASLKKQKQDASALIAEMKPLGIEIQELDEQAKACDERLREVLRLVPNIPHASVPVGTAPPTTRKSAAGASRASSISSRRRIGIWDRRWGFWISSAPPRSRARVLPCTWEWAPSWSGRSPTSCSTCTRASMATRKFCRPSW